MELTVAVDASGFRTYRFLTVFWPSFTALLVAFGKHAAGLERLD